MNGIGNRLNEMRSRAIVFLYQNSRPQFHPALYVLLYSALFAAMLSVLFAVLNLAFTPPIAIDYRLLAVFVSCTAIAELVRGNVKYWLKTPADGWSFAAMAAGGAAFGLTFWLIMVALWGIQAWYYLYLCMAAGASFYLFLGLTLFFAARKAAKPST